MWEIITEPVSNAFDFVNENEWAANLLAGAAGAGAQYLLQKDQQDYEDRIRRENQALQREYASAPDMDTSAYGGGLLGAAAPLAGQSAIVGSKNGLIYRG